MSCSGAPPALCGPVPAPDDYVVPADALVAAKVGTEEDESKAMYIMARVLEFSKRKGRYEVVDVDASDKCALCHYHIYVSLFANHFRSFSKDILCLQSLSSRCRR